MRSGTYPRLLKLWSLSPVGTVVKVTPCETVLNLVMKPRSKRPRKLSKPIDAKMARKVKELNVTTRDAHLSSIRTASMLSTPRSIAQNRIRKTRTRTSRTRTLRPRPCLPSLQTSLVPLRRIPPRLVQVNLTRKRRRPSFHN